MIAVWLRVCGPTERNVRSCRKTALHVQQIPREVFYVHISTFGFVFLGLFFCVFAFSFLYHNDMVCQQITGQPVQM